MFIKFGRKKIINNRELLVDLENNAGKSLPVDSMKVMIDSLINEYDKLLI